MYEKTLCRRRCFGPAGYADAGNGVAGCDFAQIGINLRTFGNCIGAARVKRQPDGGLIGVGTSPLAQCARACASGRGRVLLKVARVCTGAKDWRKLRCARHNDDAPQVHHRNARRNAPHCKTVRDEQEVSSILLQIFEQGETCACTETSRRRDGFVRDDLTSDSTQAPARCRCAAVPAGKLMRKRFM